MMNDFRYQRIKILQNQNILSELETFPNQAVIWGILDGHNQGQLWELPGAQSILVFEDNEPEAFVFIAGSPDFIAIQEALRICKNHPLNYPMIYCHSSYHHRFLKEGWTFNPRIQLSYRTPSTQEVSNGRLIKPIKSLELFEKCIDFEEMSRRYGSAEGFLRFGTGFALCQENQIMSEAYMAFHGRNYAELSVTTHPGYRRQNAATQVASYLAEDCIKKGLTPVWSCDADNISSLKTALKIGFHIDRYDMQLVSNSFKD